MITRYNLGGTAGAEFSECGTYRYRLRRSFTGRVLEAPTNPVVFLMLNPSTADAIEDDPTIRRCCGFARAWGHSDLLVSNLFALRSTDPDALLRHPDPVGPENDAVLAGLPRCPIIAAWGAHPAAVKRARAVRELLAGRELLALGLTKGGAPRHPLYLLASARPIALP